MLNVKNIIRKALQKVYLFTFYDENSLPNSAKLDCVIGEGSVVHKQATINNPSSCKSNITIGKHTHIVGNLTVWANAGKIEIGNSSFVGEGSRIYSAKSIRIGDRVQIAHNCNIFDSNIHSTNPVNRHKEYIQNTTGGLVKLFDLHEQDVVIEDDAWLGACVIVLKGVKIGKGAIVGAGSVVPKDIPPYAIAVGNPARIVRTINEHE